MRPTYEQLEATVAEWLATVAEQRATIVRLEAIIVDLTARLDAATRSGKRQASPFSKGPAQGRSQAAGAQERR